MSQSTNHIMMTNRPLPELHQCDCTKNARHNLEHVQPYDTASEHYKTVQNHDSGVPVVISRIRDSYFVLENKDNGFENITGVDDNWADLSLMKENANKKMDVLTQFYIGSLSIIGLYILYRVGYRVRKQ